MPAADEQHWSPVVLAREAAFRLGELEVDPATLQMAGRGRTETLEPRVMQVLVALAGAGGGVLSRDELLGRCWGGRIVGDNAVHRVIAKVRDLGHVFGETFRVETIPRVGYRMVLEDAQTASAPLTPKSAQALTQRIWSRRGLLAVGAAGAGGAAIAAFAILRPKQANPHVAALIAQSEQAMGHGLPDSEAQGVGFLEEAVALAPDNAEAWGKLALARVIMAEYAAPDAVAATAAKAQEAAARAFEIDSRQADAMSAMALLPPYFGDWAGAEQRMQDVLAQHPGHVPTLDARDFLYVAVGRVREGAQSRLTYAPANPLNAHHQYRLVYAHWMLHQVGEADRAAERGMQLWPKHPGVWFSHLWVLAFTQRADRALARVADERARPDLPPWMIETLQLSLRAIASGDRSDSQLATDALLELLTRGASHSVNAIMLLNGLGEIDRAFEVAEAYYLDRGPILSRMRWRPDDISINDQRRRKTNMLFVPAGAAMRADPRFSNLTAEMGLGDYWRQAGVIPDHLI